MANQSQKTRKGRSRPAHHGVIYPGLKFKPNYLFAIGSPIAAVLVMRGQNFSDYSLPSETRFFNIFHLYDPMAYRIEPLMDEKYESLNPILLQRPCSRNRPTFSYYKDQLASYMASTAFTTQFPDISIMLPTMPSISLPNIPVLEMAKETLNRQFSTMIDSITNVSNMFVSGNTSPKNLKRKREDEDAGTDEDFHNEKNGSSSHYRVIKQPVSHLKHQHGQELVNDESQSEIESNSNLDSPEPIDTNSFQTSVTYATVMQKTVSSVYNRIVTPVMEKLPSLSNRLSSPPDIQEKNEFLESQSNDLSQYDEIPIEIIEKRYDYYIQESLIDNNVHQVNIIETNFSICSDCVHTLVTGGTRRYIILSLNISKKIKQTQRNLNESSISIF